MKSIIRACILALMTTFVAGFAVTTYAAAPVANGGTINYIGNGNQISIDLSTYTTDPENNPLQYGIGPAAIGTISWLEGSNPSPFRNIATYSYQCNPNPSADLIDTFNYYAYDTVEDLYARGVITININCSYASAINDSLTTPKNTPILNANLLANDVVGGGNTFEDYFIFSNASTYQQLPVGGSVTLDSGNGIFTRPLAGSNLVFTPTNNYVGSFFAFYYFGYNDGNSFGLQSNVTSVNINVTPTISSLAVNDVLTGQTVGTTINSFNLLANDTPAPPVTSVTVTNPLGGNLVPGTPVVWPGYGTLTQNINNTIMFAPELTPVVYQGAVPAISYFFTDSNGNSNVASLQITYQNLPAGTAVNDSYITTVNNPISTVDLLLNDSIGAGNTFQNYFFAGFGLLLPSSSIVIPGVGTITRPAGPGSVLTFTPNLGYIGSYIGTYNFTYNNGFNSGISSSSAAYTFKVNPIGVSFASSDSITGLAVGAPITNFNLLTNDTTNPPIVAVTIANPLGGNFVPGTPVVLPNLGTFTQNIGNTISFVPLASPLALEGTLPVFTYTFTDVNGVSNTAQILISYLNLAPATALIDNLTNLKNDDSVSSFAVLANDNLASRAVTQLVWYDQFDTVIPVVQNTPYNLDGYGNLLWNTDNTVSFDPVAGLGGSVRVGYALRYSANIGGVITTITSPIAPLLFQYIPVPGQPIANPEFSNNLAIGSTQTVNLTSNDILAGSSVQSIALFDGFFSATLTTGNTATIPGKGTVTFGAGDTLTFVPFDGVSGAVGFYYALNYTSPFFTGSRLSNTTIVVLGYGVSTTTTQLAKPPEVVRTGSGAEATNTALPGLVMMGLFILGLMYLYQTSMRSKDLVFSRPTKLPRVQL